MALDHNNLSRLIERGGVHYAVPGDHIREALAGLVAAIPAALIEDKDKLIEAVLEREGFMSTGIGNGVAIPHPRNPIISDPDREFVAIGFLKNTVDWKSLDGKSVRAVILIVSASARSHLHTLSKINFLCWKDKFFWMLERQAAQEEIIAAVREAEQNWEV